MNNTNEKDLAMLKTSFLMYEETKKQTEKNMKNALDENGKRKYSSKDIEEEIKLIETAENEVIQKYIALGGDESDLKRKKRRTTTHNVEKIEEPVSVGTETVIERDNSSVKYDYNPQASYDVIPLPSNGECYKNKMSKIPVAYLTAYDENMIIAPNLYRDNKIIDVMLKEKILNSTINPDDMLEGDREAIILFLRSGYGNEYPIIATDNATNISFETIFDLSKLKFKEFKLKGDVNGWFDYTLPFTGTKIKFKFLSHRDLVELEKMEELENAKLRKEKLKEFVDTMDEYIENDKDVENKQKIQIRKAIRDIEKWEDEMEEEDSLLFTHTITNRLEMSIMEVDGVTDRKIIRNFVRNMNVRDSSALRKYINENEPGIDYNIEVEKPESLGGGSMPVFLQLDQNIFLNIAQ